MTVGVATQATVAVVAGAAVATGLVAAPVVSCRGRHTDLLLGTCALTTSGSTAVAVAVVTAVVGVAELVGTPFVTRAGRGAALGITARAASGSRFTLVAVTLVAAIGAVTGLRLGVARTIGLTDLGLVAGTSTRTKRTGSTTGVARSAAGQRAA